MGTLWTSEQCYEDSEVPENHGSEMEWSQVHSQEQRKQSCQGLCQNLKTARDRIGEGLSHIPYYYVGYSN